MLFLERPITVDHVRHFFAQFTEGLRVEYKRTFDQNVKDNLPKVVSSFANSQGGVLVIGVDAPQGRPQAPFDGFEPAAREELPLTVENICLANIHPPILPSITVVNSDRAGYCFVIMEVEESGEAPHAIENSKKVYVRTGNAANPYELAEVDLIIDLMRRRHDPLEFRDRLSAHAKERSFQVVPGDLPDFQVGICLRFPRSGLCSSQETWDFAVLNQRSLQELMPYNSLRRVPDGTASLTPANLPLAPGRYFELNRYGLLFTSKQFAMRPWDGGNNPLRQLHFGDLVHAIINLFVCAKRFYSAKHYRGNLSFNASLHRVQGQVMEFRNRQFMDDEGPDQFRCYTNEISVERHMGPLEDRVQQGNLITDILSELTWPFWQGNGEYPRAHLEHNLQEQIARYLP